MLRDGFYGMQLTLRLVHMSENPQWCEDSSVAKLLLFGAMVSGSSPSSAELTLNLHMD